VKSHAVRARFLPVTPAGVQPSGMLGRAVNAKHLQPGLLVRPSLPLTHPKKLRFSGAPGQKRRKRRPLRATGIFRFADGFLLPVLCLAAKILRFTGTLLKRPDYNSFLYKPKP